MLITSSPQDQKNVKLWNYNLKISNQSSHVEVLHYFKKINEDLGLGKGIWDLYLKDILSEDYFEKNNLSLGEIKSIKNIMSIFNFNNYKSILVFKDYFSKEKLSNYMEKWNSFMLTLEYKRNLDLINYNVKTTKQLVNFLFIHDQWKKYVFSELYKIKDLRFPILLSKK